MATIDNKTLLQSKFLYMQACGNDASDGRTKGIYLRWSFNGALYERHLPKGDTMNNQEIATGSMDRKDDYVYIYRADYDKKNPIILDFVQTAFDIEDKGNDIVWTFAASAKTTQVRRTVRLHFEPYFYRETEKSVSTGNAKTFINKYKGIIGIETDALSFRYTLFSNLEDGETSGHIMAESVSVNTDDGAENITNRKRFYLKSSKYIMTETEREISQEDNGLIETEDSEDGYFCMTADNIKYIRLRQCGNLLNRIEIETYEDFLEEKNLDAGWTEVAKLALTDDTDEAFHRLENSSNKINLKWPKFQNDHKVVTENYKNRWFDHEEDGEIAEGLQTAIRKYFSLSKEGDNEKAAVTNPDGDITNISYLDMLNLASLDFHVARMLGLGYIDAETANREEHKEYIYTLKYTTLTNPETNEQDAESLLYMTMPVSIDSAIRPNKPEQNPLSYELSIESNGEKHSLTDPNGYTPRKRQRTININIRKESERHNEGFFIPDEEFTYRISTKPIMYGILRKHEDGEWSDISIDEEFTDNTGGNEIMPIIPISDDEKLYTYIEKEEGISRFKIYSIDWFNGVSECSEEESTDETIFTTANTLIPPLNFAAHLVQKEETLLLTTEKEQELLRNITDDKTLVRITFDWNDINNAAYWYGKSVEFFFNNSEFHSIRGRIKNVTDKGEYVELRTTSYKSIDTGEDIIAHVAYEDKDKYIGSMLVCESGTFQIISITESEDLNEGVIINIIPTIENETIETEDSECLSGVKNKTTPNAGECFEAAENISDEKCWAKKLDRKISLEKFSDYTEIDEDGEIITIGGITEYAEVTEVRDSNDEIETEPTGIYKIKFINYKLAEREDGIEWYKGKVRIECEENSDGFSETKSLNVISINNSGATSELIAIDTTFSTHENTTEEDTENPEQEYIRIKTGTVKVNYHPGYRLYLTAENGFNEESILPSIGEGRRISYMTCCSCDDDNDYHSPLSVPALLMAREIIDPVKPETPIGPLFATDADFYGKSTYTMEISTETGDREPYAIIIRRATEESILNALYKAETKAGIREALEDHVENDYKYSLWNAIANAEIDDNGEFEELGGYRFPKPDKSGLVNATKDDIKKAVREAFVPVTEQPILYRYLKTSGAPRNTRPVTQDKNGMPLPVTDERFDQAPMAVKLQKSGNKHKMKFTDYTIDGATNAMYFYCASEMNDMLSEGERSGVIGPVIVKDTSAPRTPQIRKVYASLDIAESIVFEINEYANTENVTHIQIFRSTDKQSAVSARLMKALKPIEIGETICDEFEDLEYPPYGTPIYYRLSAIRSYEGEDKISMSQPTEIIATNIVDTNTPDQPNATISEGIEETDDEGIRHLKNVVIKWSREGYKCIYRIFELKENGNWSEIANIKDDGETELEYEFEDIIKTDNQGEYIFHTYKIIAENTSGITSEDEETITI